MFKIYWLLFLNAYLPPIVVFKQNSNEWNNFSNHFSEHFGHYFVDSNKAVFNILFCIYGTKVLKDRDCVVQLDYCRSLTSQMQVQDL